MKGVLGVNNKKVKEFSVCILLTLLFLSIVFPKKACSTPSGGHVEHIAAVQMYVGEFLSTMFTYAVPGYVEGFSKAEKYMTDETGSKWRKWYSEWLRNAGFSRSISEIDVGQVIVNPRKGTRGEVRSRTRVKTYTSIFGKKYISNGMIYVTLYPSGEGASLVGYVRHESDEGGVFEVSPSGIVTKSAIGEKTFDRMVLEAGS